MIQSKNELSSTSPISLQFTFSFEYIMDNSSHQDKSDHIQEIITLIMSMEEPLQRTQVDPDWSRAAVFFYFILTSVLAIGVVIVRNLSQLSNFQVENLDGTDRAIVFFALMSLGFGLLGVFIFIAIKTKGTIRGLIQTFRDKILATVRMVESGQAQPSERKWFWPLIELIYVQPLHAGRSIGIKSILYPAMGQLEPDTPKLDLLTFDYHEMPPIAYKSHEVCLETLGRYNYFKRLNGKFLLATVPFLLALIPTIVFGCLIIIGLTRLLGFSEFLATIGLLVGVGALTAFVLVSYFFTWGLQEPVVDRCRAWEQCEYDLRVKQRVTEIADAVEKSATEKLEGNIQRLTTVYEQQIEKTQLATSELQQVLDRLQHLRDDPNVDVKTVEDISFILEHILDIRLQKARIAQKDADQRQRNLDLIKNILVNASFFLAGLAIRR
jgi:hypothetical protein